MSIVCCRQAGRLSWELGTFTCGGLLYSEADIDCDQEEVE